MDPRILLLVACPPELRPWVSGPSAFGQWTHAPHTPSLAGSFLEPLTPSGTPARQTLAVHTPTVPVPLGRGEELAKESVRGQPERARLGLYSVII